MPLLTQPLEINGRNVTPIINKAFKAFEVLDEGTRLMAMSILVGAYARSCDGSEGTGEAFALVQSVLDDVYLQAKKGKD